MTALRRPQKIGPVVATKRFAGGRNRGVCLIGRAGRPRPRSIWIFLDGRGFVLESPENKAWISLDFLGFSRPNRDFSMRYAGFSAKKISRALLPLGRRRRDRSRYSYDAERSVAHRASLTRFLLFCNQLPTTEMAILSRAADGALVISLNPQLDGKIVELGYRVKCRCNRKVSVIGISVPVSQSKLGGISLLPCSAKKAA
jgi:hypothetical protein